MWISTLLLILTGICSFSQDYADIQSSARPLGLEIVDKVQEAGSDNPSLTFQSQVLPKIKKLISTNLGESSALTNSDITQHALDTEKLYISFESDVRVYFAHEGAGYSNTLGFYLKGGISSDERRKIIFPNVSSSPGSIRNDVNPLYPGDFVDIGTITAGSQLHFFLVSDGANGGSAVFSTERSLNRDGIHHVVAFAVENTAYLLIGFEDMWGGGDRDYNDCMFVVDIGEQNVKALHNYTPASPEERISSMIDQLITDLGSLKPGKVAFTGFQFQDKEIRETAMQINRDVRPRIIKLDGFNLIADDILLQAPEDAGEERLDFVDTTHAINTGNMLNADYFVTGLVLYTGQTVIVFYRIINIKRETVEFASQISYQKHVSD